MRWIGSTLALTAAMTAVSAIAADTLRLSPASEWTVRRENDSCLLTRQFGQGDQALQLDLRSYEPEGRFYVSAQGKLARPAAKARRIRIGFADVEHLAVPFRWGTLLGTPTFLLQPVFFLGPLAKDAERRMKDRMPVSSYAEPAIEAQIDTIAFEDGLAQEFVLETGSLFEPMEALRECSHRLADDWGVTFEQRQALSRVAVPADEMPWLSSTAFRRSLPRQTVWRLLLIVGEDGRVADCRLSAAVSPERAEAACAIARQKARFKSALDAEGQPTRDYWLLTMQPL